MDNRHVIEEAVFDIHFDTPEAARLSEDDWNELLLSRILPLADRVFDEFSADGRSIRLDRLEIDLGDIGYDDFHASMAERFGERLRAALREKIQTLPESPSQAGGERMIDRRRAERERLQDYLETGRLAGRLDSTREQVDRLMAHTLAADARAFADYLRRTLQRGVVVRRLAAQFQPETLAELARTLSPSAGPALAEMAGRYVAGTTADGMSRDLYRRLWERLIAALLDDAACVAEPSRLFDSVVAPFSRPATSPQDGNAAEGRGPGMAAASEVWRLRLESALWRGTLGELAEDWPILLREQADLVRMTLQTRLADAALRRRLAQGFPEARLIELARLLAPGLAPGIETLAVLIRALAQARPHDLERLARSGEPMGTRLAAGFPAKALAGALAAGLPAETLGQLVETLKRRQATGDMPEASLSLELWAYTLGHLAAGAESGRNAADYLHGLVARLTEPIATERARPAGAARPGPIEAPNAPPQLTAESAKREVLSRVPAGSGFGEEIEEWAFGLPDAGAYYRHILANLEQGRTVDLDAAAKAGGGVNGPSGNKRRAIKSTMDAGLHASEESLTAVAAADPEWEAEAWRARLEAALSRGTLGELERDWPALLRAQPDMVRMTLRSRLSDISVCRRLAIGCSEAQLIDMARLLDPNGVVQVVSAAEFVRVLGMSDQVRIEGEWANPSEAAADRWNTRSVPALPVDVLLALVEALLKRLEALPQAAELGHLLSSGFWTRALAQLAGVGGAHWDAGTCLRSLAENLTGELDTAAPHDTESNLLPRPVQESISASSELPRLPALPGERQGERASETQTGAMDGPGEAEPGRGAYPIDGAELEAGREYVERDSTGPGTSAELERQPNQSRVDAAYYRRILAGLKRMQMAGSDAQPMAEVAGKGISSGEEGEIRPLFETNWLRPALPEGHDAKRHVLARIAAGGGFRAEIEKWASRADDEEAYYRHILACLLEERDVDLEAAIRAEASSPEARQEKRPALDSPMAATSVTLPSTLPKAASFDMSDEGRESDDPAEAQAVKADAWRLRLESALWRGTLGELEADWPILLREQAGLVRTTLQTRLVDAALRSRVAQGFPEARLVELVHLLAPGLASGIETLAALIRALAQAGAAGLVAGEGYLGDAARSKRMPLPDQDASDSAPTAARRPDGIDRQTRGEAAEGTPTDAAPRAFSVTGVMKGALEGALAAGLPAEALSKLIAVLKRRQAAGGMQQATLAAELWMYTLDRLSADVSPGWDGEDYLRGLLAQLAEPAATEYSGPKGEAVESVDVPAQFTAEAAKREVLSRVQAGSGFGEEIEKWASRARDAGAYYRHILASLEQGRPVDLEAAAAATAIVKAPDEHKQAAGKSGAKAAQSMPGRSQLTAEAARREVLSRVSTESGFGAEIEKWVPRARDAGGYYRYILVCLQQGVDIDLEVALQAEPASAAISVSSDASAEVFPAATKQVGSSAVTPAADHGANRSKPVHELAGAAGKSDETDFTRAGSEDGRLEEATGTAPEPERASARSGRWERSASEPRSEAELPDRHIYPSDGERQVGQETYVANAGLVLAAPYLPRLFDMLELTAGGRFKDERAAERAIHLMQFAVDGSCDSPEFLLVLNKILCGVPLGMPIAREVELTAHERETVESMLKAIVQNWKVIGNTSVQGLRESFLQRVGRIAREPEQWHLQVEKKGIDVLLDRLPWSFGPIKYPWMPEPVYVEWR